MADETKVETADPLPYVIIFAILFLVALGTLTWTLDVWYKSNQCAINPNIWCADTWVCNSKCESAKNTCFKTNSDKGLASCLFGPDSVGAQVCFGPPTGDGPLCDCPTGMAGQTGNCMSKCISNLKDFNYNPGEGICCCVPGTKGCGWTTTTLPAVCNPTN
jgi:hypothetical protein